MLRYITSHVSEFAENSSISGKLVVLFEKLIVDQNKYVHSAKIFFVDYLLSNNHINSIIVHKFDFSDEEVRL